MAERKEDSTLLANGDYGVLENNLVTKHSIDNDATPTTDETTALLSGKEEPGKLSPARHRYVPIEPLAFFYSFVILFTLPLTQFYIFDKIGEKYGGLNQTANSSEEIACSSAKASGNMSIQDKIQAEAADYTTYLLICASIPGILQTFILGALSDRYGRKLTLLSPLLGSLFKYAIFTTVFVLDLDLGYLFIGTALEGFSGGFGAMYAGLNGAVVDVTPGAGSKRSMRLAILQAAITLGAAVGMFVSGPWIEASGYKLPAYVITGLLGLAFLIVLFLLPETRPKCTDKLTLGQHLKLVKKSLTFYIIDTPDKRRWKLIICLVTFITTYSSELTKATTFTLFLLASPFCWKKVYITTYSAGQSVINWLCILGLIMLTRRHFQDATIGMIGCISASLYFLMVGLANNNILILAAVAVGIFSQAPAPMIRATMSRRVSNDEQGALFASVSSVELLMTAVFGASAAQIYKASLQFFPGLIFVILAGVVMVTSGLLGILVYYERKHPPFVRMITVDADTSKESNNTCDSDVDRGCNESQRIKSS